MFTVIATIITFVANLIGAGWNVYQTVNEVFTRVIANSKLFLTILLIGIAAAVFTFISHKFDDIVGLVTGVDSLSETINANLLGKFCDGNLIVNFGKTVISGLITYYSVFASGIGYSLLIKLHGATSRSIVV